MRLAFIAVLVATAIGLAISLIGADESPATCTGRVCATGTIGSSDLLDRLTPFD